MLHRLMWVNITTRSCCKKIISHQTLVSWPAKTVPYEVDFTPLNVSTLSFSSQSGWHGGHISILYLLAILVQQTPLLPSSVVFRKYLRGYCGPPLRREREVDPLSVLGQKFQSPPNLLMFHGGGGRGESPEWCLNVNLPSSPSTTSPVQNSLAPSSPLPFT